MSLITVINEDWMQQRTGFKIKFHSVPWIFSKGLKRKTGSVSPHLVHRRHAWSQVSQNKKHITAVNDVPLALINPLPSILKVMLWAIFKMVQQGIIHITFSVSDKYVIKFRCWISFFFVPLSVWSLFYVKPLLNSEKNSTHLGFEMLTSPQLSSSRTSISCTN